METHCPHDSCVNSAFQGLSNGLTYGAKVRFTHALVMAILFSNDPARTKLKKILTQTKEHSSKLGVFVFVFKSLVCLFSKLRGKASSANHALAGLIAGVLWAKDTSVNTQISFYLLSRNVQGHTKLMNKLGVFGEAAFLKKHSFTLLTVMCWGVVMALFETYPEKLQNSLSSVMKFLYHDSDNWRGWKNCVPYYSDLARLAGKIS